MVIFRTQASKDIGLGHLMRCQALAQTLVVQGLECCFVVNQAAQEYCRQRHDWVGQIICVPEGLSTAQELGWLRQLAQLQESAFAVIDGYQFDSHYRQTLRTLVPLLVCFDDNNLGINLHADVIINGSDSAKAADYASQQGGDFKPALCLGADFRVLRQEFIQLGDLNRYPRNNLTLTMGGSDVANVTLPLLNALLTQQADMPIRVVTGAAYPHLAELEAFIQQSPLSIQHLHNCQQMADVFCHSKLVVSAAGGSQFEILACGSPAILLVVADNQIAATQAAAQQGWCEAMDIRVGVDAGALATRIVALWHDEQTLNAMTQQATERADAEGAIRVLQQIFSRLEQTRCS